MFIKLNLLMINFVCISIFSMDGQESKNLTKQKKPSAYQKGMLELGKIAAKYNNKNIAKLAASQTDKNSPTAVYFRASLASTAEKKEELTKKAAMLSPGRPSEAKKEAAKKLFDKTLKQAYEYWQNYPRFTIHNNQREADVCLEDFKLNIESAKSYYKEYKREVLLEQDITPDDLKKELDRATEKKFAKVGYIWQLEAAILFQLNEEKYKSQYLGHFEQAKKLYTEFLTLKYPDESKSEIIEQSDKNFDELCDTIKNKNFRGEKQ